ncbi:hypothetical protein KKI24_28985 [bacterium]|nr:hypothetical protein [bacterium]
MDALIKERHRQIKLVRDKIFDTPYARDVDIYRPYKDGEGRHVIEDEKEFEEADEVGTLSTDENMSISYTVLDTTKAVRCKINEDTGKLSHVRVGEQNEFEQDKQFHFLIQSNNIPDRTVMQLEVPTALAADDESTQTISLIKVSSIPIGVQPYIDLVHSFVSFHGDVS